MFNTYLENLQNDDKVRLKDENKLRLIELNREERLEREAERIFLQTFEENDFAHSESS